VFIVIIFTCCPRREHAAAILLVLLVGAFPFLPRRFVAVEEQMRAKSSAALYGSSSLLSCSTIPRCTMIRSRPAALSVDSRVLSDLLPWLASKTIERRLTLSKICRSYKSTQQSTSLYVLCQSNHLKKAWFAPFAAVEFSQTW
jgi:hypothetical protein